MSSVRTHEFVIRNLLGAAFEAGVDQQTLDAAEKALEALAQEDVEAPRYCTATGKPWRDRAFKRARELGDALGLDPSNAYAWKEKLGLVRKLREASR